jgi:hypothetical protein
MVILRDEQLYSWCAFYRFNIGMSVDDIEGYIVNLGLYGSHASHQDGNDEEEEFLGHSSLRFIVLCKDRK